MKVTIHFTLVMVFLSGLIPLNLPFTSVYCNQNKHSVFTSSGIEKNNPESNIITYAEADEAADEYASTKHIYTYQEAIELRKKLIAELIYNSKSVPLNWALMRFYASAPNFVGGSTTAALQYAGYIYSISPYLGCLAFEYVYTKRKNLETAESWYKNSLTIPLPNDMYWDEIVYTQTPHIGIKVTGNFNNWKSQNMYSGTGGVFKRKVMIHKCDNCIYKVIVDYNQRSPSRNEIIVNSFW